MPNRGDFDLNGFILIDDLISIWRRVFSIEPIPNLPPSPNREVAYAADPACRTGGFDDVTVFDIIKVHQILFNGVAPQVFVPCTGGGGEGELEDLNTNGFDITELPNLQLDAPTYKKEFRLLGLQIRRAYAIMTDTPGKGVRVDTKLTIKAGGSLATLNVIATNDDVFGRDRRYTVGSVLQFVHEEQTFVTLTVETIQKPGEYDARNQAFTLAVVPIEDKVNLAAISNQLSVSSVAVNGTSDYLIQGDLTLLKNSSQSFIVGVCPLYRDSRVRFGPGSGFIQLGPNVTQYESGTVNFALSANSFSASAGQGDIFHTMDLEAQFATGVNRFQSLSLESTIDLLIPVGNNPTPVDPAFPFTQSQRTFVVRDIDTTYRILVQSSPSPLTVSNSDITLLKSFINRALDRAIFVAGNVESIPDKINVIVVRDFGGLSIQGMFNPIDMFSHPNSNVGITVYVKLQSDLTEVHNMPVTANYLVQFFTNLISFWQNTVVPAFTTTGQTVTPGNLLPIALLNRFAVTWATKAQALSFYAQTIGGMGFGKQDPTYLINKILPDQIRSAFLNSRFGTLLFRDTISRDIGSESRAFTGLFLRYLAERSGSTGEDAAAQGLLNDIQDTGYGPLAYEKAVRTHISGSKLVNLIRDFIYLLGYPISLAPSHLKFKALTSEPSILVDTGKFGIKGVPIYDLSHENVPTLDNQFVVSYPEFGRWNLTPGSGPQSGAIQTTLPAMCHMQFLWQGGVHTFASSIQFSAAEPIKLTFLRTA